MIHPDGAARLPQPPAPTTPHIPRSPGAPRSWHLEGRDGKGKHKPSVLCSGDKDPSQDGGPVSPRFGIRAAPTHRRAPRTPNFLSCTSQAWPVLPRVAFSAFPALKQTSLSGLRAAEGIQRSCGCCSRAWLHPSTFALLLFLSFPGELFRPWWQPPNPSQGHRNGFT